MRISLISTGDEILSGEVQDTNSAHASQKLQDQGYTLIRRRTCSDDLEQLVQTMSQAREEADVVLICGGLGPTIDDRTSEALARLAQLPLEEDPGMIDQLKQKFRMVGLDYTDNQSRQARKPAGAEWLANPRGTAAGIEFQLEGKWFYCLPGPPREFKPMLSEQVLPRLAQLKTAPGYLSTRVLKIFGRGEGWVANHLGDLESEVEHLTLGFRAAMPEIHIKLRVQAPTEQEALAALDKAESIARERMGNLIFGRGEQSLVEMAMAKLLEHGLTLAAAESCTGGLIGKLLTDVPGASDAFVLSAVTYANEAKTSLLGVPQEVIEEYGAVSEQCARAMAEGARKVSGADLAVAVTGIAGPGGGTAEKPVGTVYLALAHGNETMVKLRNIPPLGRNMVRTMAAYAALDMVRRSIGDG